MRLIADVPLGAFLSGGVDSSAVVAMMAGLNSEPVNTCSISFGDPDFNEATIAAMVARALRRPITTWSRWSPDDFDLIDRLVGHLRRAVRRQLGHADLPGL